MSQGADGNRSVIGCHAAELITADERGLGAQVRRAKRGHHTRRTCANNNDVHINDRGFRNRQSGNSHVGQDRVPFAHAQAATRHPSAVFRNATVNTAPDCVTVAPFTANVMVAGTTM